MDTKFINLKFESNGKILEVGKGKSFQLLNIEGIESGEINLNTTDNVLSDGTRVRNKKYAFRPIMVECEYIGKEKGEYRRFVAGFFNAHEGGKLQIDYMGIKREIPYEIEGYKSKLDNLYIPFRFLVHLYCPEPFLLDMKETSEEITTWIGGLTFPLRLPTTFSIAGERIINVINKGDTSTPIRLEIHGPATNPKVLKRATGEFIKVNAKVLEGETLVITTAFGKKKVEINGENKFHYIDHESTFFNLEVGDNVIEASTEDETENTAFRITYRNRYLGV